MNISRMESQVSAIVGKPSIQILLAVDVYRIAMETNRVPASHPPRGRPPGNTPRRACAFDASARLRKCMIERGRHRPTSAPGRAAWRAAAWRMRRWYAVCFHSNTVDVDSEEDLYARLPNYCRYL